MAGRVDAKVIMEFIVTDRNSIERGVLVRSSYVVISIRSRRRRRARIPRQSGLRAVLFMAFDDAEPADTTPLRKSLKLFTAEQAAEVKRFVERHTEVGCVVCHCEGGVSRSPAVAAAICRSLGGDDAPFFRDYQPNRYVYDLLCRRLGGPQAPGRR